jgi:benzoyl-CoA reductase/2-hydroxyglutaryl-CoA dehydratase subunit BcrC/BadD/HgdB
MDFACIFVPEEIAHAAGVHLIRMFGNHEETPMGDSFVTTNECTYLRSCMQILMTKGFDYLDGFITSNSCDHQRRFYDNWVYYKKQTPFIHQLIYPHLKDELAFKFLRNSFDKFKAHIEDHLKIEITDEALETSIKLYNETRRLLRDLYELRKAETPPISGSEILDVVLAGLILPRERYNPMLKTLLGELKVKKPDNDLSDRPRILIMGSELDDSDYLKIYEDLGANLVADDVCIGSRYFWTLVKEETGNPMDALTDRYLRGQTCPRMMGSDWDILHQAPAMAEEFNCDGMIMIQLKFCDMNGCCYPMVKEELKKLDIPSLFIDHEYIPTGLGQMKTRVQAFLESLE